MKKLILNSDQRAKKAFDSYPSPYREKLLVLRSLIIESAQELTEVEQLDETVKWGEPSYLTQHGSTIRLAWKEKSPDKYSIFFKCTSKLVPTFRTVFKNSFNFIGDREIAFSLDDDIHKDELKTCIKTALQYHRVKQVSNLGL